MSMTWKEFKEAVDKQLKEKGISEDAEIWWIDVTCPDVLNNDITVGKDEYGLLIT